LPKRNLALLVCILAAFASGTAYSYLNYPEQFGFVQHIVFGVVILTIGLMGLNAPDIQLSEGGISRIVKVLFGSIIIAFLSWLLIGVVTQPLLGNVVFEMVSQKTFLLSMSLLTLSLYPVINKYLI